MSLPSQKKKLSTDNKVLHFRKIAPLSIQPTETQKRVKTPDARLIVDIPAPETKIPVTENKQSVETKINPDPAPAVAKTRISKLDQIREKFSQPGQQNSGEEAIPLLTENLQEKWMTFTQQLKEKKNPAAQSFENARFTILNENTFEVISPNNLEQKFIESERNGLTDFLQKAFNNKQLQYSLRIDEQSNVHDDLPIPPNAKEQFMRIAEEYPLVRVLKEKLKLDLDY